MQGSIGRYRLLSEVARGGMGRVFRAEGPDGAQVAIKLLLAGALAGEAQRARLRREAEALRRLDHPGVVRILDAGEHQGAPYLVLEWVEGQDLGAWLEQEGRLDPAEAAGLVARLARALAHCHQRGVLHRDLKPQNVLLRASDGAPLLTDFGLSHDREAELEALTRTGQCLGSPGWWPPEQALGKREQVDERSDVWGLGGILFTLLTGRPPLDGGSLVDAIAVLERGVPPPSSLREGIPAALDGVCLRCLTSAPQRRYPSAAAVADVLEGWLAEGAPRGARGRGRAALVLGALGLVGAVGLALVARGQVAPGAPAPSPHSSAATRPPVGDPELERLLELARAETRAGRLPEALAVLDQAIALAPLAPRPLALRARLRRCVADFTGAADDLQRALDLDSTCVPALVERGLLAVRQGRWERAGADGARAAELDPEDPAGLALRGTVAGQGGDPDAATALADQALAVDPRCVEALILRGLLHERLGESSRALELYRRALEEEPRNPRVLTRLGAAQGDVGEVEASLAALDQALELDPTAEDALVNRGSIRRSRGDLAGAHADCARILANDPDSAAGHRLRGELRRRENDREGAFQDLSRAVELDPDNPAALFWLAVLHMERDEPAACLERLERLLRIEPSRSDGYLLRARLRLKEGMAGAREDLERFLELAPPRHPRREEAARLLAGLPR